MVLMPAGHDTSAPEHLRVSIQMPRIRTGAAICAPTTCLSTPDLVHALTKWVPCGGKTGEEIGQQHTPMHVVTDAAWLQH